MMGTQSGVITYYAIHVHTHTHKFITIRCRKIPRRIHIHVLTYKQCTSMCFSIYDTMH